MSLESEIAALNANLSKLIEVLSRGVAAPAAAEPQAEVKKPKKEKAEKPVETISPEPVAETAEDHQKKAEPVIQALLNAGKKADILALNKKYGVERGRQLYGTPKFNDYLADAQKLGEAAA